MSNELLEKAILELNYLNPGEEFLVKDLFKGYEWRRYGLTERLLLGTLFLNEVKTNKDLRIGIMDKTSSNQQKYRKLDNQGIEGSDLNY